MSRIPARFLRHKSVARGITVESFLAKQEDIDTMVEYGFAGYRGLHGSPNRRPSEIVEKILHTLVRNDRELRRRSSTQSWSTVHTSLAKTAPGGVPSRFRLVDTKRKKTFQSIVEEVRKPKMEATDASGDKRTFKDAAKSVIDKDLEAVDDEDVGGVDNGQISDIESSEESDWSDEEREHLEKMFGAMSERGLKVDTRSRRPRKSIRKSRRRGDICGEFAHLMFTRDSDASSVADSGSVSLSCDTYCDSEAASDNVDNTTQHDAGSKQRTLPILSFTSPS